MPTQEYKKQQEKDVDRATKEYHQAMNKGEKDLSAQGTANKMVMRKNLLDKLNNDLNDAGKSQYEKDIWK